MSEPIDEAEKSKSQKKRDMRALGAFAAELVELKLSRLEELPLSPATIAALIEARPLRRGAKQRQLRYIAGMLSREETDAVQAILAEQKRFTTRGTAEFHHLEQWRDQLIAGDVNVHKEICERFDGIDRQHINQLIRNSRKEAAANRPPKSAKILFKYLRELHTAQAGLRIAPGQNLQ